MKFKGVKFNKGMYVSVAHTISAMQYTNQKAVIVNIQNGIIKHIDKDCICITPFPSDNYKTEIITWENVIYIIDNHARTSNKFVNFMRKVTANFRTKKVFKGLYKEVYARTKF